MSKQKYYVVGTTHRDPAWIRDQDESSELYEVFILRLLDLLENNHSFKYVLEMVYHYSVLEKRRPDLIKKLKKYFDEGRLEFGGGLVTSIETNLTGPESFIRNQLLGLKWVKEHFNTNVTTGYLIDTFGINAQVPQILRQFGMKHLLANRFGGCKYKDAFISKGLDGTELKVIGRDTYSPYIQPGVMSFKMIENWEHIQSFFADAAAKKGDGPFIVMPYIEGYLPSQNFLTQIEEANRSQEGQWDMSLAKDYFTALNESNFQWPEENGDLNPEFTATYSQRIELKNVNRRVEYLILEAEKWAHLIGLTGWKDQIDEAWWTLAFNHVHDMITGSHNTAIYNRVMNYNRKVEDIAKAVLSRAMGGEVLMGDNQLKGTSFRIYNGLPWNRVDYVELPILNLPQGVGRISDSNGDIPFEVINDTVNFKAIVPACGYSTYHIEPGKTNENQKHETDLCTIENEFIRLECDNKIGLKRLTWKATGKVLLEDAFDFLVLQRDTGNFQFENPDGGEVPAAAGSMKLYRYEASELGERILISGQFPEIKDDNPDLDWVGVHNESCLTWTAEFSLLKNKPLVYLKLKLNWKGENSRIRLKLSTKINAYEGIYEIPYGVVKRRPYGSRMTARGEWPAYRFVALEDQEHGLALINTGVPGVEVSGPTLWTTILRAPATEYAGMAPDETSSQHGEHEFKFALAPYAGSWMNANVSQFAQEINSPMISAASNTVDFDSQKAVAQVELMPKNLVMTSIKAPEDGADELIVRFYETEGKDCQAKLFVNNVQAAWESDLTEKRGCELEVKDENIGVSVKPFEIKTLRIARNK